MLSELGGGNNEFWNSTFSSRNRLLIFLVTLQLLRRGRIPVKFSILWFIVAAILLVVGIFPNFIVLISTRIGFISMSNMLVGILIFLLFAMCIALTVIVSGQATKITLLIQEVSMLKKKIVNEEKNNG